MNITYRNSTESDKNIIEELIGQRFGNRDSYGVTDNLNGRYLLAFDNNTLVAMTGLIDCGFYNGPEIDWTCIRKEYEGHGIITKMIETVIKDVKSDIYCSCWRLYDNQEVNLHHAMNKLGFELVNKEHKKFNAEHYNCKNICKGYKENCKCYEDLYIKRYNN